MIEPCLSPRSGSKESSGRSSSSTARLALTEGESPPYLLLNAEESRVSGPGGCNRLVGSFEVSEDGLRLGPIAATRMACPEAVMRREDAFLRTLEATTRYELDARR